MLTLALSRSWAIDLDVSSTTNIVSRMVVFIQCLGLAVSQMENPEHILQIRIKAEFGNSKDTLYGTPKINAAQYFFGSVELALFFIIPIHATSAM